MEEHPRKSRKKLLWGRVLAGLGAAGIIGAIVTQVGAMSMPCVDVGCIVGGILSMAAAAGGLLSLIIGGIGFWLLQTSGSGYDINWKSLRPWGILLGGTTGVLMLWLSPYLFYTTVPLWIIRAGGFIGAPCLLYIAVRSGGSPLRRLSICLCSVALIFLLMQTETRECSRTVLHTPQYMCWGTGMRGEREWHAIVNPYSIPYYGP